MNHEVDALDTVAPKRSVELVQPQDASNHLKRRERKCHRRKKAKREEAKSQSKRNPETEARQKKTSKKEIRGRIRDVADYHGDGKGDCDGQPKLSVIKNIQISASLKNQSGKIKSALRQVLQIRGLKLESGFGAGGRGEVGRQTFAVANDCLSKKQCMIADQRWTHESNRDRADRFETWTTLACSLCTAHNTSSEKEKKPLFRLDILRVSVVQESSHPNLTTRVY